MTRLFGGKMVKIWAQIWTAGAWRACSQVSSNLIAKCLVFLLLLLIVLKSDAHVLATQAHGVEGQTSFVFHISQRCLPILEGVSAEKSKSR